MSLRPEKVEAFLADLKAVYEKHGLYVSACGCCNSPWVADPEDVVNRRRTIEVQIRDEIDHLRSSS